MSVNKVILIGNLGKDPEIRNINENTPVATFSVATSESYKDKNGEWQEQTEWHNVVAWRGLAERAEKYLKKGHKVYIEGKMVTRSWEDKEGVKRYTTEVVANSIQSLEKREKTGSSLAESYEHLSPPPEKENVKQSATAPANVPAVEVDDDLPF